MKRAAYVAAAATLCAGLACRAQAPPSIETFAARERIEGATLSPDGRYLALIRSVRGRGAAVVFERQPQGLGGARVVMAEPDRFHFSWCHFATATRLLCSLRGMAQERGFTYPTTRLVGVDASGGRPQLLLRMDEEVQGEFQDRIINWEPGKPDTVLVEADESVASAPNWSSGRGSRGARMRSFADPGQHALPAVFELNVISGRLTLRQHARDPIRHWITDGTGEVRLGWGVSGATISYYARLAGDHEWRRLEKFDVFSREKHFKPVAISREDPNKAYAVADSDGHDAVWLMDLTDSEPPTLVFSHPAVDVSDPMMSADGKLLAVHYETEYPNLYVTDVRLRSLTDGLKKLLPGKFSVVTDSTSDGGAYIVRSVSDREAPTFSLVDAARGVVTRLGAPGADLDPERLAPLIPIRYPARDGTSIPGYLTLPPGAAAAQLPLVVLPHGGPISRDTWRYFFLREFLASRGYAVLQMNFRGSSGYGSDWFFAAHQDWGGLTYDDVVDGGRWAVEQGIADPARICIVGWSFGGYLALLGAQRNADLFRCAVSIAGISDLDLYIDEGHQWMSPEITEQQIGRDPVKLRRDSPRQHAAEFSVPVLIVHGDRDAQVPYEQSAAMQAALKHAAKSSRFITLPYADHQLSEEADRVILLREIESFLAAYIGPPARPP